MNIKELPCESLCNIYNINNSARDTQHTSYILLVCPVHVYNCVF